MHGVITLWGVSADLLIGGAISPLYHHQKPLLSMHDILSLLLGLIIVATVGWYGWTKGGIGPMGPELVVGLACFPGVLIGLMISEILSRLFDR